MEKFRVAHKRNNQSSHRSGWSLGGQSAFEKSVLSARNNIEYIWIRRGVRKEKGKRIKDKCKMGKQMKREMRSKV